MSLHEGQVSAVVRRTADQPTRPGIGSLVATGAVTRGEFGLFRAELGPGAGIASHYHLTFTESFYVVQGELEFHDGDAWSEMGAGDLVFVPRAGVHGLRVAADAPPAEVLTLFTPGVPREDFVTELLEIRSSGQDLTPEELTRFYARHDQYMV